MYCQLGRTHPVVNERKRYFPPEEILAEVREALTAHKPGEIDWVTFVGSGEPTLHSDLGWLIRMVKELTDLPVAVITNGALFYWPEVRAEVGAADAVLPTLDAGNPSLYRQINRPHPDIPYERLIDGLVAFRAEYPGKLWVEVMLVCGLNDTEEALLGIASVLDRVKPDEVHINLPSRPPVETWVQPPEEEGLMRAVSILGQIARIVHPSQGSFDLSGYEHVVDAIVGIITRHPMREDELVHALEKWTPGEVGSALEQLSSSRRAQVVERYGCRFWSAAPSYYPDEIQSKATAPGARKRRGQ